MRQPLRVAVVGLGKIAQDRHLPMIARSADFQLVAAASPQGVAPGVPVFPDLPKLLDSGIAFDCVVLSQPPQFRFEAAQLALRAGKHVLLEKPPADDTEQVAQLVSLAVAARTTLFTAWHSRYAAGVGPARAWLADRRIQSVRIEWLEDVRQWHPNQAWIWQPGGLGVFDPGINALSILTHLVPEPLQVLEGVLEIPAHRQTPIAARLHLAAAPATGTVVTAVFDWRAAGPPKWKLQLHTERGLLELHDGGAVVTIDGAAMPLRPVDEYQALYQHFATLVRTGASHVDSEPLRLTQQAFARCAVRHVEPFTG